MPDYQTIGMVAQQLGYPIHVIQYAILRGGAPKPKAGKVGNRWLFSPTDVERLRDWFLKNRKYESVGT